MISFYGDPGKTILLVGIGKSSAFASLIHHLNQKETKSEFKKKFSFFGEFENFLFL